MTDRLKESCDSCGGLNISCPVGCDRDPKTGELMAIPPAAADRITQLEALLQKVLDYRDGKKPYDFHRLPADQRDNECFDAWQILETELRAALHQGDRKP